jgi:hypothetical protein
MHSPAPDRSSRIEPAGEDEQLQRLLRTAVARNATWRADQNKSAQEGEGSRLGPVLFLLLLMMTGGMTFLFL